MNDEDAEIEECAVEEEQPTTSASKKVGSSKRQTTLDAFLFGDKSRNQNLFATDRPTPKKPRNSRKSVTITYSAISKDELNLRKSFGTVVEEVGCHEAKGKGINDWIRMSNVMEQAKAKAERTTLDKYVDVSSHSAHSTSSSWMTERDLESIRCYQDMYPDLNNRSSSDVVLVSISSIRPGVLPKPYPIACTDVTYGWNFGKKYVRLPYSSCNVIDVSSRYDIIQNAISKLLEPLSSYKQIEECIKSYTRNKQFDALSELFEAVLDQTLCLEYLTSVVPFMAKLALQSPTLITQAIPLLRRGSRGSVTMSQQQAASLLAHAFFCTFPSRSAVNNELPLINFNRIFALQTGNAIEKLRCLLHYFHMISKKMPTGLLTFRRQRDSVPDWSSMQEMPLSKLYVSSSGTIEDEGHGMLQVDFANEYIGGGVLSGGCVQEEIRFLICPEMIVSMLLCERMDHNEAVVICGAQRFCDYDGYSSSFRWRPMKEKDSSPRDRFGRLCCELVAIDALPFSSTHKQFNVELVDRELLKAYVGFVVYDGTRKPVATGNWGCGVFNGDLDLKSLIQLMASSVRKRPLCYFTFGNRQFAEDFNEIYKMLLRAGTTVGRLYDMIVAYCSEYDRNSSPRLFDYIISKIKGIAEH